MVKISPLNKKVGLRCEAHQSRAAANYQKRKTNFYDDKIDDIPHICKQLRAGLVEIAHGIQRERGS